MIRGRRIDTLRLQPPGGIRPRTRCRMAPRLRFGKARGSVSTTNAARRPSQRAGRARGRVYSALAETLETRRMLSVVRPEHIVVVIEQDRASDAIGNAQFPYLNSIASGGLFYSNAHGVTHPSEPNSLALLSGSTQGITDNNRVYSF